MEHTKHEKKVNWISQKLKALPFKKMKDEAIDWEKMFTVYPIQLNTKKKSTQLKTGKRLKHTHKKAEI